MNIKSPIFIGGAGRSGTRLLRSVIGKIPDVFEIPRETYIFTELSNTNNKVLRAINSIREQKEQRKALLIFVLLSIFYRKNIAIKKFCVLKNNFHELQKIWSENIINSKQNHDQKIISLFQKIQPHIHSNNIFEIFDYVIDCLCQENNCSRWVEKTPSNIFNFEKINRIYPSAKYIAITRNPYAVYASWKKKNKNIIFSILNWIKANKAIMNQKTKKLSIKYEDLITRPEDIIKKICCYIEEPYSEELLKVEVVNNKNLKGFLGFSLEPLSRWETELSLFEKFIIKIFTQRLAYQLGYEL